MVCIARTVAVWSYHSSLEVGVVLGDAYGQWESLHAQQIGESRH